MGDKTQQMLVSATLLCDYETLVLDYAASIDDKSTVVYAQCTSSYPVDLTFAGFVRAAAIESDKITSLQSKGAKNLPLLKNEDLDILLRHMVMNKMAVLSEDGTIVKILRATKERKSEGLFSVWTNLLSSNAIEPVPELADAEIASLQLRRSIYQVESNIEALNLAVQGLLEKAVKSKVNCARCFALVFVRLSVTKYPMH
jgi:hypothetical protein